MKLTILIPCYNEEKRLFRFQKAFHSFCNEYVTELKTHFSSFELLFVNDGSSDRSLEIMNEFECPPFFEKRIESYEQNQGKGFAVKTGLGVASGDWILMTDVDLSTPLRDLFKLVETKADLAFGSRRAEGANVTLEQNGLRPWLGRAFNHFVKLMTGLPYQDTQCGFKLFSKPLSQYLAKLMKENGFAFDVECLVLASFLKANIQEVPVEWQHDEDSRVSAVRDGINMGLRVLAIRWRRLTLPSQLVEQFTEEKAVWSGKKR